MQLFGHSRSFLRSSLPVRVPLCSISVPSALLLRAARVKGSEREQNDFVLQRKAHCFLNFASCIIDMDTGNVMSLYTYTDHPRPNVTWAFLLACIENVQMRIICHLDTCLEDINLILPMCAQNVIIFIICNSQVYCDKVYKSSHCSLTNFNIHL